MLAIGPLSCLSVHVYYVCLDLMLVCCCQIVRWIEMKLDKEIGFGPGRIVLGKDAAPPPKGAQPPIFGLRPSWPNDWMD